MKNGKYTRKSSGMKVTSVLLAALLLVGCSVGATLAWMTAKTEEVKNTFTVGNIQIDLKEHEYVPETNTLKDGTNNTTESKVTENANYPLTPGKNMPKDPFVTVNSGSEKCWLFVRIDEFNSCPGVSQTGAVDYTVDAEQWKALKLDGFDEGIDVYYRVVDTAEMGKSLYVLGSAGGCDSHTNGCVTINPDITGSFTETPVLKFTAAAIQYDGLEPAKVDSDLADSNYVTAVQEAEEAAALNAFNNLPGAFKNPKNQATPNP